MSEWPKPIKFVLGLILGASQFGVPVCLVAFSVWGDADTWLRVAAGLYGASKFIEAMIDQSVENEFRRAKP